jgi:glycosyltransferase involved in cell wall biosynthesis
MRILFLDKNILVDRRIDLFSQSLKKQGHETRLLYLEPPVSFEERFSVDIEAIPISPEEGGDAAVSRGIFTVPPHVLKAKNFLHADKRGKEEEIKQFQDSLERRFKKGSLPIKVISALSYPSHYLSVMRESGGMGFLGGIFYLLLWVLKLKDLFAISLPASNYPGAAPSGSKLTHFDLGCIRHAVEVWHPDIVVANDFPTLRAAATIKDLLGVPLIYDSHELYSYQPTVEQNHAVNIFREETKLLKHVDGMIVMNELHAEIVMRDFKYRGIYTICTNATNRGKGFDPRVRYDKFREVLPIPKNHKIMLFQGGVNVSRRIDFLLRGLAKAKRSDVHMVFLSWGSEVEGFKSYAKQLNIAERVHFRPFVDWDEVLFYAASADCGIMPYQATDQNTAISSPNKMYEFIMAATPIIGSSDLTYVNKIVGGEKFGVVRPLRSDVDYSLAIEEMFDEKLGGPERFRPALIEQSEKYSWDNEVLDSLKMYSIVADKKLNKEFSFRAKTQAVRILADKKPEGEVHAAI